ncbi:MAG: cyclic nucleotide-binding domain-containing protein [Spirochaetia bacterium]|nr:cyclic nucleotide-binding domain-containing protein [Spirochaetia bacterium]
MLPENFPYKDLFLALATSVVFSTLFINALTIKLSLHLFKLDRLDPLDQAFYHKTISDLRFSVLEPIQQASQRGSLSPSFVANYATKMTSGDFENSENELIVPGYDTVEADLRFAISSLLLNERRYYDEKIEDSIISKEAYQLLIQSVTDRMDRFSSGDIDDLETNQFDFGESKSIWKKFRKIIPQGEQSRIKLLTTELESLLHLRFSLEEALEKATHIDAKGICIKWIEESKYDLEEFYSIYTHFGTAVKSLFIANSINASSEAMLNSLHETSIITGAVFARVQSDIHESHTRALAEAHKLLRPSAAYLLTRVPLFSELPKEAIIRLTSGAKRHVFKPGQIIVNKGDVGNSFFLITAGILEVEKKQLSASASKPRLFVGDFFGELSLLFHQPRNASVATVTPTELVEIHSPEFQEIMQNFPAIREEIKRTALSRCVGKRIQNGENNDG